MRILLLAACCLLTPLAYGQWQHELSAAAYGGNGPAAFWLQANRFGVVPNRLPAAAFQAAIQRSYHPDSLPRRFDWGAGLWAVANVGPHTQALLPEAFVKGRAGRLELWVGRRREYQPLLDSTLSSGGYVFSGNALPMPKIQLGFNEYVTLRFLQKIVAIRGYFSHIWYNDPYIQRAYVHQKALYLRFGNPQGRVQVHTGVTHAVQWGGRANYLIGSPVAVNGQLPHRFRDYLNGVVIGFLPSQAETDNYTVFDGTNRIGNHLGQIDVMLSLRLDRSHWDAYYQHPFEDASSLSFQNMPDGLYGLKMTRVKPAGQFALQKIVVEGLSTLSQSGPDFINAGSPYRGTDNYFNHSQYRQGWSYRGRAIGTPFIMPHTQIRPDLPQGGYFPNNRVNAFYIGMEGRAARWHWLTRLSLSRNFGTYIIPYAGPVRQLSAGLQLARPLPWLKGIDLTAAAGLDAGGLLPPTAAVAVGLRAGRRPYR